MTAFAKPLYVDNHLIVCAKPAGVPVTPPHRLRTGSMQSRVIAHLGRPMSLWIHQSRHGDTTAIATRQGHDLPASLL